MRRRTKAFYELAPARLVYRRRSCGTCLLRNGVIEYHGDTRTARQLLASVMQRRTP